MGPPSYKDQTQHEERLCCVTGPSSPRPDKPVPQTPAHPAQISHLAGTVMHSDLPTSPQLTSPAASSISRLARPGGSPVRSPRSASPAHSYITRPSSKRPNLTGIAVAVPSSPLGLHLGPSKPRPNFGSSSNVATRSEEPSELPYTVNANVDSAHTLQCPCALNHRHIKEQSSSQCICSNEYTTDHGHKARSAKSSCCTSCLRGNTSFVVSSYIQNVNR